MQRLNGDDLRGASSSPLSPAELDAFRGLYSSDERHLTPPTTEFSDVALLLLGERPAANVVSTIEASEIASAERADPTTDLVDEFDFECTTVVIDKDGIICFSRYLSDDPDRMDDFPEDRKAKGLFLGYPRQACNYVQEGKSHRKEWKSFLSNRDPRPTDDQLEALSTIPYLPEPSEGGFRRAVERGQRYRRSLAELRGEVSELDAELRSKTEKLEAIVSGES